MNAKHTPGPWELRPTRAGTQEVFATVNIGTDEDGGVLQPIYDISFRPSLMVGEDGLAYAMLTYESYRQFPSVDFKEMQKANARLIAAAPDLLEAARALLGAPFGTLGDCDEYDAATHRLEAAIAKAEEV